MIDLMLNDLRCPPFKSLQPNLKIPCLKPYLDFLITLCLSRTTQ